MASGPNDFRDPKVTSNEGASSGGIGKWIAIAVGVLVALLLLGWLLGLFADNEVETTRLPAEDGTVIITE